MELFEVPSAPIFNGEEILPLRFRQDPVAKCQWLFERHYENSEFALGISFRDRFFREGLFMQYQFFRGQASPPGWIEPGGELWWSMEKDHWLNHGSQGERSPFILEFRNWIFDKAAPHNSFDLWYSKTNPWLDRYLEFAPMSLAGF